MSQSVDGLPIIPAEDSRQDNMRKMPNVFRLVARNYLVIDLFLIALLWCGSLVIVDPIGNFPLNDDWSFGLAVRNLIGEGDFRPLGWTSPSLITNVLWGSLFCIPGGFSFTALRLSTLTLSLVGTLGTYLLMTELHQPRGLSVLAALTLGFNPIYYVLSNTFMTDIPYTAITILAALFFVRNLRSDSDLALLIGTVLLVAATLSRQFAICISMAFAASLILKRGFTGQNLLRAAIPPAFSLGALLVFQQALAVSGRQPALYGLLNQNMLYMFDGLTTRISFVVRQAYVSLLYLGWFLLPILIFAIGSILQSRRRRAITPLIVSIGVLVGFNAVAVYRSQDLIMPLFGNIIGESGLGTLTLRDTYILNLDHVPSLPTGFWLAITFISLLGAVLLATAIGASVLGLVARLRSAKMNDKEITSTFLFLSAAAYLLPVLVMGVPFDRYLVPAVPFLAAGIASVSSQFPQLQQAKKGIYGFAAVALLVASSLFTICGTRDYLAWNRVRWNALHDLVENKNAKVEDIDGGFEFNGLYLYDPQYKGDPQKSWWWVHGDEYVIGFGEIPGYTVIKEYHYNHWMPPYVGQVVVLQASPQFPNKR